VDPDYWGLLIFEMMAENGVHLLLHSLAVDIVKKGNCINGVVVENTSGRQAILGKVIIDCTGEAHIAARAGAPYDQAPKEILEPHTVSFTVDGVQRHDASLPELDSGTDCRENPAGPGYHRNFQFHGILLPEG
jgi:flavin-dependent dehydrogenase